MMIIGKTKLEANYVDELIKRIKKKKELKEFSDQSGMVGIDRIVPIGATMDFSLIWDGHNLINTLSREVEIV